MATNAAFATLQLLLAIGIAWRPAARLALAASVAWSVAVWWLGEGLGGVLTGSASPWNGAPGAAILYALLALLLWPADRDASASFVAARPLGRLTARLLWLLLWGSMSSFALRTPGMAPPGLHGMLASMASGEPRWHASFVPGGAALLRPHGLQELVRTGRIGLGARGRRRRGDELGGVRGDVCGDLGQVLHDRRDIGELVSHGLDEWARGRPDDVAVERRELLVALGRIDEALAEHQLAVRLEYGDHHTMESRALTD